MAGNAIVGNAVHCLGGGYRRIKALPAAEAFQALQLPSAVRRMDSICCYARSVRLSNDDATRREAGRRPRSWQILRRLACPNAAGAFGSDASLCLPLLGWRSRRITGQSTLQQLHYTRRQWQRVLSVTSSTVMAMKRQRRRQATPPPLPEISRAPIMAPGRTSLLPLRPMTARSFSAVVFAALRISGRAPFTLHSPPAAMRWNCSPTVPASTIRSAITHAAARWKRWKLRIRQEPADKSSINRPGKYSVTPEQTGDRPAARYLCPRAADIEHRWRRSAPLGSSIAASDVRSALGGDDPDKISGNMGDPAAWHVMRLYARWAPHPNTSRRHESALGNVRAQRSWPDAMLRTRQKAAPSG